jgi:hypothetical protein
MIAQRFNAGLPVYFASESQMGRKKSFERRVPVIKAMSMQHRLEFFAKRKQHVHVVRGPTDRQRLNFVFFRYAAEIRQ